MAPVNVKHSRTGVRCIHAKSLCVSAGSMLCFLHADTHPPRELVSVVRGVMADPNKVLGGFRTIIQTDGRRLHGMTFHHLVKTYYVALLLRPLAFARYRIQCLLQACISCIPGHAALFNGLAAVMMCTCIPVYALSKFFCHAWHSWHL